MNDLIVPGWAVVTGSVIVGGAIAWLLWLTIMTFANKQAIAVNTENDKAVQAQFDKIHQDFATMKEETKQWYFRIEDKIEKFVLSKLN